MLQLRRFCRLGKENFWSCGRSKSPQGLDGCGFLRFLRGRRTNREACCACNQQIGRRNGVIKRIPGGTTNRTKYLSITIF